MAKAHHQHEKNRKKKNLAEKTAILQKVTPFDILTPEELNEIAQKTTFQNFFLLQVYILGTASIF